MDVTGISSKIQKKGKKERKKFHRMLDHIAGRPSR